jgi:hypothetical protein
MLNANMQICYCTNWMGEFACRARLASTEIHLAGLPFVLRWINGTWVWEKTDDALDHWDESKKIVSAMLL